MHSRDSFVKSSLMRLSIYLTKIIERKPFLCKQRWPGLNTPKCNPKLGLNAYLYIWRWVDSNWGYSAEITLLFWSGLEMTHLKLTHAISMQACYIQVLLRLVSVNGYSIFLQEWTWPWRLPKMHSHARALLYKLANSWRDFQMWKP